MCKTHFGRHAIPSSIKNTEIGRGAPDFRVFDFPDKQKPQTVLTDHLGRFCCSRVTNPKAHALQLMLVYSQLARQSMGFEAAFAHPLVKRKDGKLAYLLEDDP